VVQGSAENPARAFPLDPRDDACGNSHDKPFE
jgi:hypothetical protein